MRSPTQKLSRGPSAFAGRFLVLACLLTGGLVRAQGPVPLAPYSRFLELVDGPQSVWTVQTSWLTSPRVALAVLVSVLTAFVFMLLRERRLAEQRRSLRAFYALSEDIVSARSSADILQRLVATLRLYLHNRRTNSLDGVPSTFDPKPASVPLNSEAGVAACFRNRTLLTIRDTRRGPFTTVGQEAELARSEMYVPMFSENEPVGVLEIDYSTAVRQFSYDQQAAAQHLGNQIATALKLLDQQSIREQLFRTEKLAAAGQLISGVANELETPLQSMAARAEQLLAQHPADPVAQELRTITSEAQRAAEIVSRLVSFSTARQAQAKPVELNHLLNSLIEFREREWKARGVRWRNLVSSDKIFVLGAEAQLEQVFLNLLIHAEQCLTDSPKKTISVASRMLARRALVEIAYSSLSQPETDPLQNGHSAENSSLGLGVCRGIIQSHGGEVRFVGDEPAGARFEVELPIAPAVPGEEARPAMRVRRSVRQFTVLVVDPEAGVQRLMVSLLSERGHRVVPVSNGEQAVDLTQRLHFDLVFCSVRLPGSNWVEVSRRVRDRVGGFILLTEGYNDELVQGFRGRDGFVLKKPVHGPDLDQLLATIEARLAKLSLEAPPQ
jgi:signal transduction histidine kinase